MNLKKIPVVGRRLDSALRRARLAGFRPDMFDAEEGARWRDAGLDLAAARARHDQAMQAMGKPAFDAARDSVHYLLAAAVGQRFTPARVLELGTFKGEFTALLADLYPSAEIVTVDLPASDPLLRQMYGRAKPGRLDRELSQRTANLERKNIAVVKSNTLFLLDAVEGPFDLVWVDAGHKYPDVAWDLSNAVHLVRPGGVVMADDVTLDMQYATRNLGPDSEIVLRYLAERTEAPVRYFLKRRDENAFLEPRRRKYVAWWEKPAIWPPKS